MLWVGLCEEGQRTKERCILLTRALSQLHATREDLAFLIWEIWMQHWWLSRILGMEMRTKGFGIEWSVLRAGLIRILYLYLLAGVAGDQSLRTLSDLFWIKMLRWLIFSVANLEISLGMVQTLNFQSTTGLVKELWRCFSLGSLLLLPQNMVQFLIAVFRMIELGFGMLSFREGLLFGNWKFGRSLIRH